MRAWPATKCEDFNRDIEKWCRRSVTSIPHRSSNQSVNEDGCFAFRLVIKKASHTTGPPQKEFPLAWRVFGMHQSDTGLICGIGYRWRMSVHVHTCTLAIASFSWIIHKHTDYSFLYNIQHDLGPNSFVYPVYRSHHIWVADPVAITPEWQKNGEGNKWIQMKK